jgi:hypothetical protein
VTQTVFSRGGILRSGFGFSEWFWDSPKWFEVVLGFSEWFWDSPKWFWDSVLYSSVTRSYKSWLHYNSYYDEYTRVLTTRCTVVCFQSLLFIFGHLVLQLCRPFLSRLESNGFECSRTLTAKSFGSLEYKINTIRTCTV